jgi:hypothetical protein
MGVTSHLMRRSVLGVVVGLAALALPLTSSAAAAIDVPEVETLLRGAPEVHPHLDIPRLEVPNASLRATVPPAYGTDDPSIIRALDQAKTSTETFGHDVAEKVTQSHEDEDLVDKCLGAALRKLLAQLATNESTSTEQAISMVLQTCLQERFPNAPSEQLERLSNYIGDEIAARAKQAFETTSEQPAVFVNWVSDTAISLEETPPPTETTPTTTTTTSTDGSDSGGGFPTGLVVVIALALLGGSGYAVWRRR